MILAAIYARHATIICSHQDRLLVRTILKLSLENRLLIKLMVLYGSFQDETAMPHEYRTIMTHAIRNLRRVYSSVY